jgi:RNA polymerase sporulation-specific sigma factor
MNVEVELNKPIGNDKDGNEVSLAEVLPSEDNNVEEEVELKMKIKKLYEKIKSVLKEREREILTLRFGLYGQKTKTQNQIAEMMGISRSYVSRIETKAIGKLSGELEA